MEFLGKAVEVVIDFVCKHGVRQVTYIIHYKKNVHELNDSVKHLGFEKERIDHQCDEAEKNLNNIEGRVTKWVRNVSEIETIVKEFENDDGHQRARSLNCYFFPYLWNRHRLGRQAKKMEEDVKKLIHESPKYDEVSYRQDVTSNDATLSNFGFIEFGSTKSIMEKVMTQLEDSTVRMIGLYGPGGVGKSTLIKEIARKAKYKKLFDVVVSIEITANPNLQKVQEEIAYVLGLRLEGEGENVRADCLRRRLKREKGRTLLIFDDIWNKLDLNKLGIPLHDDDDDDLSNDNKDLNRQELKKKEDNRDHSSKVLNVHKGHKILLTSRDKNVLCVQMDVKLTFCVKELDNKDALMLFQKLVGIRNEMSDSKQEIVKKYCAGLPMAIVTIARALRSKSESVWEATLEKLKKEELVGVQTSMDISVKMSYDHLENEDIKYIFLLCAQMGHQPLIMDLVKYCFGLGILQGVSSLWEARDKIKTSIQKLKDSGLLLDESSNNNLNMHDMVRDAALSIAHKDHNFFTLRNGKLDDWPELENCTSISICSSEIIDGLPEVINCPQLKLLQIETNDPSLEIPKSFFRKMKNLRVLILIGFHLSDLPSSIQCLLKLRMLCLEGCTLDFDLSTLGKLEKLRILSFSGSQLKTLPAELQSLDKLRLLDISDCSELKNIPPNLISSFTCLEELYIRESLITMLVERETNKGQDLFLSELENLHQLKVVDLSVPCVSVFPNHLFFDKLKDYKIVIGYFELFSVGEFRMLDKNETFRVLALQLKDDIDIHSQESIKLLFKTVQSLLLGKIDGVQKVVNELNMDGFPDLKHLSIINNYDIKYVSSTEFYNYVNVFPNLESLCLYNLRKLEMICYGPVTVVSFAKLKIIKVEMCHRLRNLYSFFMVKFPTSAQTCEISEYNFYMEKFLSNLETIEVSECESLKEILQISTRYGKVEFLKLHSLTLRLLPSITCFYTKMEESNTSEEDEQIEKTTPLFGDLVEIPNLESLSLSSLNIHKIWSDQHFIFQNLIKLVVKDCDKLTYLCSLSMASNLKKLKSLVISECPFMKKIFKTGENSAYKVCVLPNLEEFDLSNMNSLTDIWETKVSVDSFSSLMSMNIEECNKLVKIFPSHIEGWIECLDNLKVSRCKSVEVIFEINDSQAIDAFGGIDTNLEVILLEYLPKLKQLWSTDPDGILNFKKLRTINVANCDEVRNLFPASVAKDVQKLERMSVSSCRKMEEIVASQHASEANLLAFPELTYVRLDRLPKIKHFYQQRHPIKCPKLKEFSVYKCQRLKTFIRETCKTTNEDEQFVFSAPEVIPNLEYMEIDFKEAQKLLPEYQMHRLKQLHLNSVESVDLLYHFPYTMPNLEKLQLTFQGQEFEATTNIPPQKRLGMVLQLKELVLLYSNIKDLEGVPALRRLELLSLVSCHKLTNLCPSSVSFTYMTSLKLNNCDGLRNLMASSTAKTMVQLKTMKVIGCHKLEQIVSNEGSEEGKVMKIVFSKLITVQLVGLKKMRSFCSYEECEFEFPSLEIVIVRECPKMEKFSERESIAPKLKNVFGVEGDQKAKWHWEGHLNATIQKVFHDKLTFSYTQHLSLENYSEYVEQLWHGPHSVHQNSFGYLKRLIAIGCDTLEHVIPSHLLSCFHNLEDLYVSHCTAAQSIFNINDENRLTKASGIFRLKTLNLSYLPKLEHVWDKDPDGIIGLQVLKEMRVYKCTSLKSLFPASVAKDLTRLEVLQVIECEELSEILRKDEKGEEGETTTPEFGFFRLTSLTLVRLPRLKYSIHCSKQEESILNLSERDIQKLCLGSRPIPNSSFDLLDSLTMDNCQFLSDVILPLNLLPFLTNLKTLKVRNCNSVKAIFDVKCTTQGRDMTSTGETLPFPMKKLTLSQLQNLKNVWNEDPHGILSMLYLQEVHVEDCEGLTSVFPASIAKDIVELKNLVVKNCEGLMTIVAEDNIDPSLELMFPCPRVRSLKLQGLSKLKYFYYSSLKSDIYTHLESHTVEQLECLSLGENGVKMILLGEFQRNLLDNLKALTLCFSSDEFEYEFLEQVPNIEKLVVCDGSFKRMFCCESPNNVDYSGLLLQLKVLHLKSLENLVSIGLENTWAFVKNLETFEVISCSTLENLVSCKVSFSNLICLKVKNCDRLSYLFTSSTARSLAQLKRMEIKKCESIEEIVSKKEGEESNEDEIIFPQLNCLNLDSLRSLRSFYKGSLNFPSLEELSVKDCHEMVTLCAGNVETDKLSQVTIIHDGKLPPVANNHDKVIPLETDINFTLIKEFLKKAASSRSLKLRDRADLKEIWSVSVQIPDLFSYLETLIVEGCHFLSYALPFTLLPSLPKLETLKVQNCDSVKTIFDVQCPQNTVTSPLQTLVLWKLPNLESVWNEDPAEIVTEPNPAHQKEINPKLTFPTLTSLTLWDLPNFKHNTIHSIHDVTAKLITPNLEHLTVGENELKMIVDGEFQKKNLDKLKALTVYFDIECDEFSDYGFLEQLPNVKKLVVCGSSFEVIFVRQRPDNSEHLLQLKELCLKSLAELVSIGLENSWTESFVKNVETFEVIGCSSLKSLIACKVSFFNLTCLKVKDCDNLLYLFTPSTARSLVQLKRMKIKKCKSIEEIVSKEEGEESDEIIFPNLSCLNLDGLWSLKRFYKGSLSFPSLEELSVKYCIAMVTLCAGTLEAGKLCQITINRDGTIPLETDLNFTMRKNFLKMKASNRWKPTLELRDRADLQEIWRVSLQIPHLCFSYLETLIVDGCHFSSIALPFTLLPLLPKLETLEVRNCDSVKTIFDVQYAQIPLKTLVLWKLPNLESVWNEDPAEIVTEPNPAHPKETNPKLTFPTLTSLTLWDLPKFNHNTIHSIHHATAKLITPNLEHLTVGENELKIIVAGEFQKKLLDKLKALTIYFDIECDEFLDYGFLEQLANVKKLVVCGRSFDVIFVRQRPNNSEHLLQLKELCLESLPELVSIGFENSWTEPFVKNLETFEVISCFSLENLVSCRVSFSKLICLKVENCDKLTYLFTSPTAKSLAQLQRMEIKKCKSIKEIVFKEEGEESDEDEIIFSKLSYLNLDSLLKLRRFYKGSLNFPLLKELSLKACHEMETLCAGNVNADKLSHVTINDEKDIPLKMDLNSTMRKEFMKKISELEQLDLKSRPGLQEIWYGSLHIPDFSFSNLAILNVDKCQFLSDAVLPFHLLPLLPKLETLKVQNCDFVKTIFDVKCTKDTLVSLKKLVLSKLPNLENVWNEDPQGILRMQHLKEVHVNECKGLSSVFPASVAKDLMKLEDLVVEDCEGLMTIVAEECIEDEEIIFERLQVLHLKRLKELMCFYAGNFTLTFPSLKEVHVIKCSSMKTFSAVNKINHLTKWYSAEYVKPRLESDLNFAVRRNFEEEAPNASSAII